MTDLNFTVDNTRTAMTIQIENGPSVTLTAGQVETLITTLADMRGNMSPPVDTKVSRELPPRALHDPDWTHDITEDSESLPGMLLRVRHPGMGWLPFLLRPESARLLGASIAEFLRILDRRSLSPKIPDTRN